MTIGDLVPRGDNWIVKRFKDLERRIAQLSTARSGNAMTISGSPGVSIVNGGNVVIYDGGNFAMKTLDGRTVLKAGQTTIPDGSGRLQQVFILARDDGTTAFYVGDFGTVPGHTHQQAWAFTDRAGNTVLAEDTTSGVGLANPYIPLGAFADITPPTATTTSASFQAMQWLDCHQQHAQLRGSVLAQTPAGTTGQFRLTVAGTQIGTPVSVAGGTFAQVAFGPFGWPTGTFIYEQGVTVQLEGRVTGGAGALGIRSLGTWGIQS